MSNITFVIPFKYSNERRKLLGFTLQNLKNQSIPVDIIVSEEGKKGRSKLIRGVSKHIFMESSRDFSRAATSNFGVVSAETDMIVIHDGDILMPLHYTEFVMVNLKEGQVVYTIKAARRLNQEGSEIAKKNVGAVFNMDMHKYGDEKIKALRGLSMGVLRKTYILVGGMREEYVGWGGEDDSFYRKIRGCGIHIVENRVINCIHLWHEPADRPVANKDRWLIEKGISPGEILEQDRKAFRRKYMV